MGESMDSTNARGIKPVFDPAIPEKARRRLGNMSEANTAQRISPMRQVLYRDQVVGPLALDQQCRQLLLRAQRSISSVLSSQVYASELHGTPPEGVLRQHEWEIAVALRDITELRAEHASTATGRRPGPMTAAVLESHQRALELAWDAITSRVGALESYAEQVEAADAAQQDWRIALKASGLNDRYLDLVARTAADEHAIAEISSMTEQASAAARAFRDSLQHASLAAEALTLISPEP
jgi:hypothetical protein